MAKKLAIIDKKQEELLKELWPGKVTVVLERKRNCGLPKTLFGREETIGLRIPDYKLVAELLNRTKKPLIGTSANISGRGPFARIKEVLEGFEEEECRPDLILDAGNLPPSSPSLIIDLTSKKTKILRK